MAIRPPLNVTDRHRRFLREKVEEGVYATEEAAVDDAVEQMMLDEMERDSTLNAMADEIRARAAADRSSFIDIEDAFAPAFALIAVRRSNGA